MPPARLSTALISIHLRPTISEDASPRGSRSNKTIHFDALIIGPFSSYHTHVGSSSTLLARATAVGRPLNAPWMHWQTAKIAITTRRACTSCWCGLLWGLRRLVCALAKPINDCHRGVPSAQSPHSYPKYHHRAMCSLTAVERRRRCADGSLTRPISVGA